MNTKDLEKTYKDFVESLFKNPAEILATLTPRKVYILHATFGLCGEAGELLDSIKKHVMYNQPTDTSNIIEELGDIEFYLEAFRAAFKITRDQCLEANMDKLSRRYRNGYSDQAAKEREDKLETGNQTPSKAS